ncbi:MULTISPECIES: aspartate--ammonia ligase [Exiguobacterium]|uniref:aspartate--ammonia ligase n=1 Tax=Exiguobacterium TaxID=33986 RepID=UPI001BEA7DE1|nr:MULTISPECIES: aspartate--ammonia ligase [Exiguobacterium]MCT4782986.1 aspartate--ammonia ligase [Exiguobacterium himgiriensis]
MTTATSMMKERQQAITSVKATFEEKFSTALGLTQVQAPLFVTSASGVNDHLNGVERIIQFDTQYPGHELEIVQSLAKWKREALGRYGFDAGEGLYTQMRAIRRDEELDATHSLYVDQWDWERVITREERTTDYLKATVESIYAALLETEKTVEAKHGIEAILPEAIHFITSQELEDTYPTLSPKDRESAICKEYGAVFISQIGGALLSGEKHDGRAADYDDWSLNGDILVWHPELESAFELSSMGIRVDEAALAKQLEIADAEEKRKYPFHQAVLEGRLPLTIGGGIGQSRVAMYLLRARHIGEVQSSVWPSEVVAACEEAGISLL